MWSFEARLSLPNWVTAKTLMWLVWSLWGEGERGYLTSVRGQTSLGSLDLILSMKTLFWPLASLDQRWGWPDQSSFKGSLWLLFAKHTMEGKSRGAKPAARPWFWSHRVPRLHGSHQVNTPLSSVSDHPCWSPVEFGKRMGWVVWTLSLYWICYNIASVWGGAWGFSLVAHL